MQLEDTEDWVRYDYLMTKKHAGDTIKLTILRDEPAAEIDSESMGSMDEGESEESGGENDAAGTDDDAINSSGDSTVTGAESDGDSGSFHGPGIEVEVCAQRTRHVTAELDSNIQQRNLVGKCWQPLHPTSSVVRSLKYESIFLQALMSELVLMMLKDSP